MESKNATLERALKALRSVCRKSPNEGEHHVTPVPTSASEPDQFDPLAELRSLFTRWFDECTKRDSRWTTTMKSLHLSFCTWLSGQNQAPCTRDQFRPLLAECSEIRTVGGEEMATGVFLVEDIAAQHGFNPVERESRKPTALAAQARPQTPAVYKIVRHELKTPPVLLPSGGRVVNVELFVRTTLCQLDCKLRGQTWLAGNWSLSMLIDRLAACGCVVEIEDHGRVLQ